MKNKTTGIFVIGMCLLCLTGCGGTESKTGSPGSRSASIEDASQHQDASAEDSKTEETAYIDYPTFRLDSYEAYSQYMDSNTLPDYVIRYDDLAVLGAFKSLVFLSDTRSGDAKHGEFWSYMYTLDDGSGKPVDVHINHKKEAKEILERRGEKTYIPEDSPLLSEHDIVPSDMRHLRTDVRGQYCENGIRYDYNAAGVLICIRWENEDIRLTLSNNGRLDQYPVGYDTPVSKLLFGNSHIDAIKNVPVIYRLCE